MLVFSDKQKLCIITMFKNGNKTHLTEFLEITFEKCRLSNVKITMAVSIDMLTKKGLFYSNLPQFQTKKKL